MSSVKKTEIEKLENSAVKMIITVDGKTTRENYNSLIQKYSKEAQIKGFRKGKVPTSIIEKKFGESIQTEAFFNSLEDAVKEALASTTEKPLHTSTPKLLDEESIKPELDKDFSFAIQYDVYPTVKIENYEGIIVESPEVKITDTDVNEELKKIQEQNAMLIDKSEGKVESDDSVTINYVEIDEAGKEIQATAGEDFTFTVGSGYSPYLLEEDVLEMKKGETKEIEKSFEKDYKDPKIAGKTVKIKVTIKGIKQKDLPDLDDELAQDVSEDFETIDDLKKDLKDKLNTQVENRKKELILSKIFEELFKESDIELPESMIQAELQNNLHNFSQQMGMSAEQLTEMISGSPEGIDGLMNEWRPNTEKNIKRSLILNQISDDQKIEVTNEELEDEYEKIATANNRSIKEIKDYYQEKNGEVYIKSDIQTRKAMDFLVEKAEIKKGKKISFLDLMSIKE